MSFAQNVKLELMQARPKAKALRQAQAFGLFAFARAFSPDEVSLRSESIEVAEYYRNTLRRLAPRSAEIVEKEFSQRGKKIYSVSLPREQDRKALLTRLTGGLEVSLAERFPTPEEGAALLSGAFLVCGNMIHPEKSYHLEFIVREQPLAEELLELLNSLITGAGLTKRRNSWIVYSKECVQIEDLLTLMGASRASLAMIEIEIIKGVRNTAMRRTNCETANIDKTVKASAAQVADIQLILEVRGLESLPEQLREAALIRLEHPELSLRELAAAFPTPISRSGVHHRLAALTKIAQSIREEQKEEGA
ncbi:MAG: DNA-binding protein WhiA [Oscillospiraceae bacterium]|jgi:DNA-binding protein WhiA